ncbi:hypothetical protein B0H13DRAFT_2268421 [Mycena leptocephala]|nr:hypothetical protein B0H13DRAFT_2268421 [Mycena leptocephala]
MWQTRRAWASLRLLLAFSLARCWTSASLSAINLKQEQGLIRSRILPLPCGGILVHEQLVLSESSWDNAEQTVLHVSLGKIKMQRNITSHSNSAGPSGISLHDALTSVGLTMSGAPQYQVKTLMLNLKPSSFKVPQAQSPSTPVLSFKSIPFKPKSSSRAKPFTRKVSCRVHCATLYLTTLTASPSPSSPVRPKSLRKTSAYRFMQLLYSRAACVHDGRHLRSAD